MAFISERRPNALALELTRGEAGLLLAGAGGRRRLSARLCENPIAPPSVSLNWLILLVQFQETYWGITEPM